MILRNTAYNLLGLGMPLGAAVVSIPILIAHLGEDRFGLLTLIWAVVSYFGLFDFGLGRALTQQLSIALASSENHKVGSLVGTAVLIMTVVGIFAGLLLAVLAPWGVDLLKSVPNRAETVLAIYAMAVAIPFIVLTSAFRGILEAQHAFGIINLIRVPMGLFTFLAPVAVVLYGQPRLDWIAIALTAGRVIACFVHAYFAWRVLPADAGRKQWRYELLKPLCVSGGWLTVSNIISPFMGYVDRFVIGAIVSASAVAYYATPYELVTKLWIVPGALTAVLFPAFARQMIQRDPQTSIMMNQAVRGLFATLLPVTVTLALFAKEILSLWINPAFAQHSALPLQIFAAGMLINCLAHVPLTLLQSAGAAKSAALIHLCELPFFLAALWWLTTTFGVVGAAIAWFLRMVLDTSLMFAVSERMLGNQSGKIFNVRSTTATIIAMAGFAGACVEPVALRLVFSFAVLCCAIVLLMPLMRQRNWKIAR